MTAYFFQQHNVEDTTTHMYTETHWYNHRAAFSPVPKSYFILTVDLAALAENWIHSQPKCFDMELNGKMTLLSPDFLDPFWTLSVFWRQWRLWA